MSPRGRVNRQIKTLTLNELSYSTRSVDCRGIKSSRVDRSKNEVIVSKDPALHKMFIPKISREVQIRM
jgi:hypothetical protein